MTSRDTPKASRGSRRLPAPRPPSGAGRVDAGLGLPLDVTAILRSLGEVPYHWDLATDTLVWGANATEVLRIDDGEAIATGRAYARLIDSGTGTTRFDAIAGSDADDDGSGVPYQVQYRLDGGTVPLWIEDTGRWFAGPDGRPAWAHGVVRSINERHAREERLAYLSQFDELTGEINRARLTEVLGAALDEAIRYRASCGFLIVALDNFSHLNEAYGFAVADEVIGAIAKRIRTKMRGGDSLGRFSGNKFGIVLKNCSPKDMVAAAERLLVAARDDLVQTSAGAVAVTVTIGGVAAPRHARNVAEILARAQDALETAKGKRRGSFQAFRPDLLREAARRENIRASDEIIAALNERRIVLAFEPVAEIASRKPAYYEGLMRIRRADGSLVGAGKVIPVAERLGLVRLIDHRVLELVIAELAAAPSLRVGINVSAASATDPDWWNSLEAQLRAHPGIGSRLTLEITETAAIHNIDDTRGFISRAKDLGCRIAVDDFGAGYTSFRNLRKLGVDILKIDGAFVQNLARSEDDRVFVRTLLELGRSLGLETVAEWVQDEQAAAMLAAWGCDYVQGALIGLATIDRPGAVETSPEKVPAAG